MLRGLEKKLKRAALAVSGVLFTLLAPALAWATGPLRSVWIRLSVVSQGPTPAVLVAHASAGASSVNDTPESASAARLSFFSSPRTLARISSYLLSSVFLHPRPT